MPITKTMAYKVGDETFPTIEEAKIAAIWNIFDDAELANVSQESFRRSIAQLIVRNADDIIEILTCKAEEEKPTRKPRKDKGTKRKKEMTAEEVK